MKLPVLFCLFVLLFCSCNMSRHYAHMRLGNHRQEPFTATENKPVAFSEIRLVKMATDSGLILPKKPVLILSSRLKHSLSFTRKSVSADTLLSAKYKPKPFDYHTASYAFGPPPKPGLFSEDDYYSLWCILFCIGFMICAALAIAIGATVDGSLFSLTGGIFCGLLCVAAVLFLVKIFVWVSFLW